MSHSTQVDAFIRRIIDDIREDPTATEDVGLDELFEDRSSLRDLVQDARDTRVFIDPLDTSDPAVLVREIADMELPSDTLDEDDAEDAENEMTDDALLDSRILLRAYEERAVDLTGEAEPELMP